MFEVSIPKLTNEELRKRYEKIKPIISVENKKFWLRNFSTKELKQISPIPLATFNDTDGLIKELNLIEVDEIFCIHIKEKKNNNIYPTISEILSQIDKSMPYYDNLVAFEIVSYPKDIDDLKTDSALASKDIYVSIVKLYIS